VASPLTGAWTGLPLGLSQITGGSPTWATPAKLSGEHPLPVRDRASRIGRQDNPLAQVGRTVLPLSHKSLCHPEPVNRLAADF
jgi:hypothetical protein